jgi:hypothetical protein
MNCSAPGYRLRSVWATSVRPVGSPAATRRRARPNRALNGLLDGRPGNHDGRRASASDPEEQPKQPGPGRVLRSRGRRRSRAGCGISAALRGCDGPAAGAEVVALRPASKARAGVRRTVPVVELLIDPEVPDQPARSAIDKRPPLPAHAVSVTQGTSGFNTKPPRPPAVTGTEPGDGRPDIGRDPRHSAPAGTILKPCPLICPGIYWRTDPRCWVSPRCPAAGMLAPAGAQPTTQWAGRGSPRRCTSSPGPNRRSGPAREIGFATRTDRSRQPVW